MVREIQAIPPAPRRVRWRAVLWHQWLLVVVGGSLSGYGSLIAWMLFLAAGGKASDNRRLDKEPIRIESGIVTAVEHTRVHEGIDYDKVSFEYPEVKGTADCYFAHGKLRPGDVVVVEYLTDWPNIFRIEGSRLDLLPWWLRSGTWLATLVLPGLPFLLLWTIAVLRLRHMMSLGDVGVAEVVTCRKVRLIFPGMLATRYAFKDHRAADRVGAHWVHCRSPLGRRLLRPGERLGIPVLHSRRWPQFSRLALPDDFAPLSPSCAAEETMRT